MSNGSQIGGIVGGIIGAIITRTPAGFQYGYMIGAGIGGYVDPAKVQGPRLTDTMAQTSTVGGPIPFGFGQFVTGGNVIWTDELRERKRTSSGKGSPTETTTYTYTRSYAVGVCEGPILDYIWIKRNGKYVYAADPEWLGELMKWSAEEIADLKAVKQKFLSEATLYMGTDSQMPDATIEAVEGVGNVSPFRDLAYIVLENEDETDLRGAVSQFEFCIDASDPTSYLTSEPPSHLWELFVDGVPTNRVVNDQVSCVYADKLYCVERGGDKIVSYDLSNGQSTTRTIPPVPGYGSVMAFAVGSDGSGNLAILHRCGDGSSVGTWHVTMMDQFGTFSPAATIVSDRYAIVLHNPAVSIGFNDGYWSVYMSQAGVGAWSSSSNTPLSAWPFPTKRGSNPSFADIGLLKVPLGWLFQKTPAYGEPGYPNTPVCLMSPDGLTVSEVVANPPTKGVDLLTDGGDSTVVIRAGGQTLKSTDGGGTFVPSVLPSYVSVADPCKQGWWYILANPPVADGMYRKGQRINLDGEVEYMPFVAQTMISSIARPVRIPGKAAYLVTEGGKLYRSGAGWEARA